MIAIIEMYSPVMSILLTTDSYECIGVSIHGHYLITWYSHLSTAANEILQLNLDMISITIVPNITVVVST